MFELAKELKICKQLLSLLLKASHFDQSLPSIATSPIVIITIPIIWEICSVSPSTMVPSKMAEMGTRKVTSNKFVAPADAKILKYNTYATAVESIANVIRAITT